MPLDTKIVDATGTKYGVKVDTENSLSVATTSIPPIAPDSNTRIFRSHFTSSAGVTDMRVDGSVTSQDFVIESSEYGDRYIDTISFVIADAGLVLNEFGKIGALTNGVHLFYEDPNLGNVDIHDALKSNFDFIRLCGGEPAFGTGTGTFRAPNVISTSEAVLPQLDFTKQFGLPWGIRLPKNSKLRLVIRVQDNVTAVDQFDCIAFGFDRLY